MKRVVLDAVWYLANLARRIGIPIGVVFRHLSDKAQDAAHNVSHRHLSRLSSRQPLAHLSNAAEKLRSISSLEFADNAEE
jgi:nucleoside phosphorylase